MSPMKRACFGPIEGIESIYVDNFENKDQQAYFLSHYHSDHTFGLSKELLDHLKTEGVSIYASKVTVAIVKNEYGTVQGNNQYDVTSYNNVLKVLELGNNTVTFTKDGEEKTLNVIALDAKHCWGSLMFLFQYNGQNILYTGDFRITKDELRGIEYDLLRENGQPIRIDKMYVDTTFKMVPAFPKRSVVVSRIVDLVVPWLEAGYQIHIITSALFAYEDICNAIYAETGEKTKIRELKDTRNKVPRSQIYAQFPEEMPGIMTEGSDYKIELYHFRQEDETELKVKKNTLKIIKLNAEYWKQKPNLLENFVEEEGNVTKVCFATHCGIDELFYFITYLNRIVDIPVDDEILAAHLAALVIG